MDPTFSLAHFELGQAFAQKQRYDAAIAALQKAIELSGHRTVFDANLAYVYAVSGRRQTALDLVRDLQGRQDQNPASAANIALVYVGLGNYDEAMNWLNKAFEERFNPSILLRPAFDRLRSDPRFQELRRRVGLSSKE
jgi:Flp pilus assembly protein TadD